jgi:hypothetical protein
MELMCTEAQPQLEAHAAGSLDLGAAAAIEGHLQRCQSCRQEFELECRLRRLPGAPPATPAAPALFRLAVDRCDARTSADRLRRTGTDLRGDLETVLSTAFTDPWLHFYCPLVEAARGTRVALQLAAVTLGGQICQVLAQLRCGLGEGRAALVAVGFTWADLRPARSAAAPR